MASQIEVVDQDLGVGCLHHLVLIGPAMPSASVVVAVAELKKHYHFGAPGGTNQRDTTPTTRRKTDLLVDPPLLFIVIIKVTLLTEVGLGRLRGRCLGA